MPRNKEAHTVVYDAIQDAVKDARTDEMGLLTNRGFRKRVDDNTLLTIEYGVKFNGDPPGKDHVDDPQTYKKLDGSTETRSVNLWFAVTAAAYSTGDSELTVYVKKEVTQKNGGIKVTSKKMGTKKFLKKDGKVTVK